MVSERVLRHLTFPVQYLEIGESLAREGGHDLQALYRYCGIDLPTPFMPWQTINGKQLQLALAYFLNICPAGRPPLVMFMEHFPLTTHGPIGMLAITSATLGEALQGALTYAPLVMPAFGMRRQDLGGEVHTIVERRHDFGAVNDFFTETVVTAPLKIMPFLTEKIDGASVHLMHGPTGDPADYEAAFGLKFVFNARQNKFVLPAKALDIPLIARSRASHLLMKATLEQQCVAAHGLKPLTQEVRRLLHAALVQKQVLDADRLAQALAMSPRTLSRRIKGEGTTLPQLRSEVGVEYAEMLLLQTERPIAQIAQLAGFADAAAFSRAFKRTTGQTPSLWRLSRKASEISSVAALLTPVPESTTLSCKAAP
ncbi:AraC family transcriptional regulator [Aquabacterium soli]|uniref:AraC family transcriptional regulator n=1 Tax=Aquabacterium soli TaxID=2493092 RepID=A0A3R8TPY9_9BURK|nr:AraC family transcriptional regulator [Aquabacterium soli]RRS01129.1 AraC family transcriptional regulator [Aquabacterium soli]